MKQKIALFISMPRKTCSCCGEQVDKLLLGRRKWSCAVCGTEHDRDINDSVNIKNRGITVLKAAGLSISICEGMRNPGGSLNQPVATCEARSLFL